MTFSVQKDQLKQIVDACKERKFAEEVELLRNRGEDLSWLLEALNSDLAKGISNDEESLNARRQTFGSNAKQVKELPGLLQLFCQAMQDFTLRILLVAAILSIALEVGTANAGQRAKAWIQGFAILVAVFICALVTSVNDYQKERQFQSLFSIKDEKKKVTLRRDGIVLELHQDYLLVGDVVTITEGMEAPADGLIITSADLTVDQSALTGQTQPVKKASLKECISKMNEIEQAGEKNMAGVHEVPTPVVMSGTKVLSGQGLMLVTVVGIQSCSGAIREALNKDQSTATPLQEKLEKLAGDIGRFGLYSSIVIIIVLLIRFAIIKGITREWDTGTDLNKLLSFLIIGITVVVVAIPEGLPLSVTLSLAFSVKKMLIDQNLVRRLEACETMGGANNICSDKTGTLTQNKMTLTKIWNARTRIIDHNKSQFTQEAELDPQPTFAELFKIASLINSTARLFPQEKGSSTQIAILKYFHKMKVDCQQFRKKYETMVKFPFSSSRKRMSVVINYQDNAHLFIKGASELILQSCNQWFNTQSEELQPLTPQLQDQLKKVINSMAEQSLRTLCLGYKKLSAHDDLETRDMKGVYQCEKENIVLLGIIGVRDVPRPQVPAAIQQCHRAGITIRMVTGDNIVTAKAIARDVGIITKDQDYLAMQGPQFSKLVGGVICAKCRTPTCDCPLTRMKAQETNTQLRVDTLANLEAFDKIKDKLLILARSRPEDKYCLVTGLKERGNVVAVTGDGTNDAPALKKADVGFAMGIAGTQVAREAAAIILIDDNFSSIVKAVLWGRNIYDSIRKFIQFQLTVNVVAVVCTLVGAAVLQAQVLKPIQMLWINLIMDTLASLALATQDPENSLLERGPHSRDEYIISRTMLKHIIGQSIFQLTVMMILVFAGEKLIPQYTDSFDNEVFAGKPNLKWHNGVVGGNIRSGRLYYPNGDEDYQAVLSEYGIYSRHFTVIFNTFVMMQVFNFLNARKLHEEVNIFSGVTKNPIFPIVVVSIFILQIILVTFAGNAFGVYSNYGLTIQQWAICIAIGSFSLVVSLILKCLPCGRHGHINEDQGGIGNQRVHEFRRPSVLSLKRIEERVERDLAKNNPLD